ncbi:MAG: hypothetical protein NC412_11745 [Roseburia sp.]|nr:hypothetical protein [Roseburia sp.]MCM1279377.1 hypothetical protein [Robinsoniella sp.]
MSIYKKSFIITASFSVVSIVIAIILNYGVGEEFWCNVCLGIFGSSLLTAVTSIVGYFVERRSVTEGFYVETLKLLRQLNKYQYDFTLDDKIDFFLLLSDYDITTWDMYIRKMDFFNNTQRKYVHGAIYNPLFEVRKTASSHAWHFRRRKNGTGRNEAVMQTFVNEIEPYILKITKYKVPAEDGKEFIGTNIKNKIVEEILAELDGQYYVMMYGKKKANSMKEKQNG